MPTQRGSKAGVNQENFIGQVFLAALVSRGHADLRRRKIEGGLYHDDHEDVCQALFRMRRVTMAQ